jgi:hypothetical protein
MAPASITVLDYLTRPNPTLTYRTVAEGTLTVHDNWLPIEGTRPWEDFTYDILCSRYQTSLNKLIIQDDPSQRIRHGSLDDIVNEDTVEALVTVNNLLPVSNALYQLKKGLAFGRGSRFFRRQSDGSPDWGLGTTEWLNDGLSTLRNLCPGDVKVASKWNNEDLLRIDWSNYLDVPYLVNRARPLEQVQHYGMYLNSRYAWVLTDDALVVVRITHSVDEPRSPKPSRKTAHQRVMSNTSNLSSTLSAMSFDNSAYSGASSAHNPAPLEITRIPWTAKGHRMTINLALYFLARLADEDCSVSFSYPSLDLKLSKISRSDNRKPTRAGPRTDQPKMTKSQLPVGEARPQSYWVPAEGISWSVIQTDLAIYLPGASVERQDNENGEGYMITAVVGVEKPELIAMLADLKGDTIRFKDEGGTDYSKSQTRQVRYYYGSTFRPR